MDWVPALTTTTLLAAALWLGRNLILTRLKAAVQLEFDSKIEAIRSELRKSEELLKAELRAKESQITSLQSGALTGLVSRQAALDKRRLDAVDQLWSSMHALTPAKAAAIFMAGVKFEAVTKEAAKNQQFRELFGMMATPLDNFKSVGLDAAKARPYVSDVAWALFSAYQAIVMFAVLKLQMIKSGLDAPEVLQPENVTKLVAAALPHYSEYLKQYGDKAYHLLLEELETKLLQELRAMLQGHEADKFAVAQAARILKEAQRVMETVSSSSSAVNG